MGWVYQRGTKNTTPLSSLKWEDKILRPELFSLPQLFTPQRQNRYHLYLYTKPIFQENILLNCEGIACIILPKKSFRDPPAC